MKNYQTHIETLPKGKSDAFEENLITKSFPFLAGGGEMGELIRSLDWSKTPLGSPDMWTQSLRIAVRIMLDCPFGMYIAWGNEYIQLYNDGYRPILGTTKHPQALGISTRITFAEIWTTTIGSMFDGVMEGTPVGFPDFILHLNRNGYLEECIFDFSYSPIRLEDGEVGGVLVTVIETTEKVKAVRRLKESENRFQNLVREANVGIIVLSGEEMRVEVVNEAYGRLIETKPVDLLGKPLFDVIPDAEEVFRPILNKVRLTGESLYLYDQPYSVVVHGKKVEGYLNLVYQAYKEIDGTITGITALCQDVTETVNNRKKIEESEIKLQKQTTNLKLATESANVGTWSLDVQTQQLEWSALHKKMWGYDEQRTDLVYEDWYKIIVEEDKGLALERVEEARISHNFYEVEYRINRNDDNVLRWMRSVGKYYYNDKGEAETLTGISLDITKSKQLEDNIRESEQKIRNFILQAPVGMCLYRGPQHIIEIVNDELLAIWDKSLDSVLDKPLFEALPEARNQGFEALFDNVYTTGEKFSAFGISINIIRHGKYETIYGNLVYEAFREVDGTITGIVEVISNVTEQVLATQQIKESENQFRTFADSIQNLAWIAQADGWIYWYNQQWYDYTGTTLEEMSGWGWNKVHHPDHIERVVAFVKEAWKKDEAWELTFPLRRNDGEYHWFLTRAYPVKDAKGNIERWIGTNTDIHEQKLKEQQKDEFISIASHEMKTPLTTAKGYIELLTLSLDEEDPTALYAIKANQAVEKLHDLVTELLDASKIQNGQLNYTITTFDFNKMVDETLENFQLSTKNHSLQKTGNCSPLITGDQGRLQQVLINLLSNAVKYSPRADKVLINIEQQDGKIQVSVQDFGVGMSSKHLDKIFERYYRVQEHAVHFQGLGIGLYISHNIIARHHGTMWAESEPKKGSTFYFTLPL